MFKKLLTLGLVIATVLFTTGCTSSFIDPQRYLELDLSSTYLNEHSEELLDMYADDFTIADLENMYVQNVTGEVEYFFYYIDAVTEYIDDATLGRAAMIYDEIYSHSTFSVADAEKTDFGYEVDVTISPINVIVDTITEDAYNTIVDEVYVQDLSAEELENMFVNRLLDLVEAGLDTVEYGEDVVVTVKIIENEDVFEVLQESWSEIDTYIIAY